MSQRTGRPRGDRARWLAVASLISFVLFGMPAIDPTGGATALAQVDVGENPPDDPPVPLPEPPPPAEPSVLRPLAFAPLDSHRDSVFWKFVNTSTGELGLSIELGYGPTESAPFPLRATYLSGSIALQADPVTASIFADLGAPWVLSYSDRLIEQPVGPNAFQMVHLSSSGVPTNLLETEAGILQTERTPDTLVGAFERIKPKEYHETLADGGIRKYVKDKPSHDAWLLTEWVHPDGSWLRFTREDGLLSAITTDDGRTVSLLRTGMQVTDILLPDSGSVSLQHQDGRLAALTDGAGYAYELSYDEPAQSPVRLTRLEVDGVVVVNALYEASSPERIELLALSDNSHSFVYEPSAGRTVVTDETGEAVVFSYDDQGRTIAISNGEVQIVRTFDDAGKIKSLERPDGEKLIYIYDEDLRIREVRTDTESLGTLSYDATGAIAGLQSPDGSDLSLTDESLQAGDLLVPKQAIVNGALTAGVDSVLEKIDSSPTSDSSLPVTVDNRSFIPRTMLMERMRITEEGDLEHFPFVMEPGLLASSLPPLPQNDYQGLTDISAIVMDTPGGSTITNWGWQCFQFIVAPAMIDPWYDWELPFRPGPDWIVFYICVFFGGGGGIGCTDCESTCERGPSPSPVYTGDVTEYEGTYHTSNCLGEKHFQVDSTWPATATRLSESIASGHGEASFCWTGAGAGRVNFTGTGLSMDTCITEVHASCGATVQVHECRVAVSGPSEVCVGTPEDWHAVKIPEVTEPGRAAIYVREWRMTHDSGFTDITGVTGDSLSGYIVPFAGDWHVTATGDRDCLGGPGVLCASNPGHFTAVGHPNISRQPATAIVGVGQDATFSVEVAAVATLQWRVNGQALAGETDSQLTLPDRQLQHDGSRVDVVVTNACGTSVSEEATLYVVGADIAADGNRDGMLSFSDPADDSYLFWINDDRDIAVTDWQDVAVQDDVDATDYHPGWPTQDARGFCDNPPNSLECQNDDDCQQFSTGYCVFSIQSQRDLEDFARLHLRLDANSEVVPQLDVWLQFRYASGNPAINLFRASSPSDAYLFEYLTAYAQAQEPYATAVDQITTIETNVGFGNQHIHSGLNAFLFEGAKEGRGELTLTVRHGQNVLATSAIDLELRSPNAFYQHYRVVTTGGEPSPDYVGVGSYDYTPQTDDLLMFVHGWNVSDSLKRRWAATVFKRLWWQGYRGHVGLFDWPNLERPSLEDPWSLFNEPLFSNYNDSEMRAWRSARALGNALSDLTPSHAGRLRVLAHSQGNVAIAEALHLFPSLQLSTYIATQAAIPAHAFDPSLPFNGQPIYTPDVYSHFPSGVAPESHYLANVSARVTTMVRFYNPNDFALNWYLVGNNLLKPGSVGNYSGDASSESIRYDTNSDEWYKDRTYYNPSGPPITVPTLLNLQDCTSCPSCDTCTDDRYYVFAYGAATYGQPLGSSIVSVAGFSPNVNLDNSPYSFDHRHYSHSRQFRSTLWRELPYWRKVLEVSGLLP